MRHCGSCIILLCVGVRVSQNNWVQAITFVHFSEYVESIARFAGANKPKIAFHSITATYIKLFLRTAVSNKHYVPHSKILIITFVNIDRTLLNLFPKLSSSIHFKPKPTQMAHCDNLWYGKRTNLCCVINVESVLAKKRVSILSNLSISALFTECRSKKTACIDWTVWASSIVVGASRCGCDNASSITFRVLFKYLLWL